MRAMMNPQTLRAMLQLQQSFSGLTPPSGAPAPAGGLDFSNLLGTSSAAAPPVNPFFSFPFAPPQQQQQHHHPAPGERFRHQLDSLNGMGFTDRSANIRALVSAHGNVNRAVEILLESPPEMPEAEAETGAGSGDGGSTEQAGQEGGGENSEPKGTSEKKND